MAGFRVGLITEAGGAHLSSYLESLAQAEEVTAVSLSDPSGDSEALARKTLGTKLTAVFKDPRALLRQEKPQMALVSMEAVHSPPAIEAALDAGCHVLSEKPGCVRAEDFEKLTRKAKSKGLPLVLA
ncbi:MAG: Gfo/Idh/MocA family oxidoreductase, partial [Bryobacteraceae bacterium]